MRAGAGSAACYRSRPERRRTRPWQPILVPEARTPNRPPLAPVPAGLPRRLTLGLRHDADVGLRCLPALRIELLRFLVRNGPGDDDILARLPVHGRGDPVLGGQLKR